MSDTRPIVVLGPTAGGKSALALALATALGGEIIGADSMQVYRGLDAGTAKPSPAEREAIPHHVIDCVDPDQPFTLADWLAAAEAAIADVQQRGLVPIVVGGTNLYLKALLEGMVNAPPGDPALRAELAAVPEAELHGRLAQVDPAAAERIHPNDRKRLTRALEVYHQMGQPFSKMQTQWDRAGEGYRHDARLVGLWWDAPEINPRINRRVRAMFEPDWAREQGIDWWPRLGLVEECRTLEEAGRLGPQSREALGYKQVLDHLAGRGSVDDAMEQTKILTRRYAKAQRTWLKRFRHVHWLPGPEGDGPSHVERAMAYVGDGRGLWN